MTEPQPPRAHASARASFSSRYVYPPRSRKCPNPVEAALGTLYVALHLVAAYKDLPVRRRQACQHPLHAWAVILARLDLVLWGVALVSVPISLSRAGLEATARLRSVYAELVAASGGL